MGSSSALLSSSSALLHLCMGVCLMIGLLHFWMARSTRDPSWWIAVWAGLSFAFAGARIVHLTTEDPEVVRVAGSSALLLGPYLVWTLAGFGRSLNGGRLSWQQTSVLGGFSLAWTVLLLATPWFVETRVETRLDLFGHEHLSVHTRWPTSLLGAYIAAVTAWGIRRLRRESPLQREERSALIAGVGLYALLGVGGVLTSLGVLSVPSLAEYGPIGLAVSLSYLLVLRRRRIDRQLEDLLARQESLLAASEERYRDLVERAPIGVCVAGPDGALRNANPRFHEMIRESGAISIEDRRLLERTGLDATIAGAAESHDVVRSEHQISIRESGDDRVWQVTASPLDDADGAGHPGVLVLVDDVTRRSALERRLRQAQKMDSIAQLAAGIAHEINNPMAYVRANLGAMQEHWDHVRKSTEGRSEVVEDVAELESLIAESMEGVERTIAIVRDMRDFAHAGDERAVATDLRPVLESCLRVASVVERSDVDLEVDAPEFLRVDAPPGPLRQVFLNLVVNAMHAVDGRGRVLVSARACDDRILVTVDDDGPGIPDAARSRIFDPFYTTKPVGTGTGLGLYVSYQLVRSFDGELHVESSPWGGARLRVDLPAPNETSGSA